MSSIICHQQQNLTATWLSRKTLPGTLVQIVRMALQWWLVTHRQWSATHWLPWVIASKASATVDKGQGKSPFCLLVHLLLMHWHHISCFGFACWFCWWPWVHIPFPDFLATLTLFCCLGLETKDFPEWVTHGNVWKIPCMVCQWLWTFVKETAMCTRSGSCILMFFAIHNVRSSNQCPLLHSLKSVRTQLQTRLAHSCVKIENVTVVVHLCNGACQFWNDCSMSSIFVPEVALGCEPVQIFILTTVAIQKFLAMTIGSLCQFHFLLGCLAWWVKDESFIHSHKWLGLEFMSVPSRKWRHSNVLALTRFRSCTQIGADTDGFKEKRRKKELKGEFMDIFICVHSMQV